MTNRYLEKVAGMMDQIARGVTKLPGQVSELVSGKAGATSVGRGAMNRTMGPVAQGSTRMGALKQLAKNKAVQAGTAAGAGSFLVGRVSKSGNDK